MGQSNIERAAELRRAYQKKWRDEHKDRVSEYNRRYWEKKAAQTEKSDDSKPSDK